MRSVYDWYNSMLTWIIVALLAGLFAYGLTANIVEGAGVFVGIMAAWLGFTRKLRKRLREQNTKYRANEAKQRQALKDREEQTKRDNEEEAAKQRLYADWCQVLGTNRVPNGDVAVYFINNDGLRHLDIDRYCRYLKSVPKLDEPKCCFLYSTGTKEFSLGWHAGPRLWRANDWRENEFLLEDFAGCKLRLALTADFSDAIETILRFVTSNSSVADVTLHMLSEYGVPALAASRGDDGLGRLRVGLQLGVGIWKEEGHRIEIPPAEFDLLGHLASEHDPGRPTATSGSKQTSWIQEAKIENDYYDR